jgi:SAM-dependent methyltransferase
VSFPFALPPTTQRNGPPVWTGKEFLVGDKKLKVLDYSESNVGWVEELTAFHEETAGSDHFIDQASRNNALAQLLNHLRNEAPIILEVGCSSGFMLRLIHHRLPHAFVLGADVVRAPLEKLASDLPGVPLFRFDVTRCPLPNECVDAVVMLNVLEHIEHDRIAIQQAYRILKKGGIVVIEVPAGPKLYDSYDKYLMHFRRYTLSELKRLLEETNFMVLRQSHLGFFVYPGFWMVKQRNKRLLTEEVVVQQQAAKTSIQATRHSKLLSTITRFESLLGRFVSFPFGIRCIVTAVKAK